MRDVARAGVDPDPDLLYRALPYAIEPEWTRGHRFCVKYELRSDESGAGGAWYVNVDDGRIETLHEPPSGGDGRDRAPRSLHLARDPAAES